MLIFEIAGGIILAVALLSCAADILFLIGALAAIAITLVIFCCVVALLPAGSIPWIIAFAAGLVIARWYLNKRRMREARRAMAAAVAAPAVGQAAGLPPR